MREVGLVGLDRPTCTAAVSYTHDANIHSGDAVYRGDCNMRKILSATVNGMLCVHRPRIRLNASSLVSSKERLC
jgi:hypothetical protein